MSTGNVYVVILNWNGWRDTIECLESVFHSTYPNYRVIVCDNGSEDGSVEQIKAWAEGRLQVTVPEESSLRRLSSPPVPKPVPYVEHDRATAERGDDRSPTRLIIIHTGGNLGFAGGSNVGLRYALAREDFAHAWLLNNDTVVKPDAMSRMVARMAEKPEAGICGSCVLNYFEPNIVQALGGARYNRWLGIPRHVGEGTPAADAIDAEAVEQSLAYIAGSSMLVSRQFLTSIGLMAEDYFLYYEELDWALRARRLFSLSFAAESVVYHKQGATLGSRPDAKDRSDLADYYGIRNRLLVTRRYFPLALPTVYLGLLITLLKRVRNGQGRRALMVVGLMLNGLRSLPKRAPGRVRGA